MCFKSIAVSSFVLASLVALVAFRGENMPATNIGSLTDSRDGKTYKTVVIGNAEWMAQNLNYASPTSFVYDNDEKNAEKYGRLYPWADINTVCPNGWRMPAVADWKKMFTALKLKPTEKMKDREDYAKAIEVFRKAGFIDENSYGGLVYPIEDKAFNRIGDMGIFWSSTTGAKEMGAQNMRSFTFYEDGLVIFGGTFRDKTAISCRCVKN